MVSWMIITGLLLLLRLHSLRRHVWVKIWLGGRQVRLKALRDTGNGLWDPFSGQPVLVVGRSGTEWLLGQEALKDPVEVLVDRQVRCRLLPFRSLAGSGLLLGVRCDKVRIGGLPAPRLVAFSNQCLCPEGQYQAIV